MHKSWLMNFDMCVNTLYNHDTNSKTKMSILAHSLSETIDFNRVSTAFPLIAFFSSRYQPRIPHLVSLPCALCLQDVTVPPSFLVFCDLYISEAFWPNIL